MGKGKFAMKQCSKWLWMMKLFQDQEREEDPGRVDLTREAKDQMCFVFLWYLKAVNGPQGVKVTCYMPCYFLIPNMVVNDPKAMSKESRCQKHHKEVKGMRIGMWSISLLSAALVSDPKMTGVSQGQGEEGLTNDVKNQLVICLADF